MLAADQTVLVIIDAQERLLRVMPDQEQFKKQLAKLIAGAQILHIPALYTEQAPDKIGATSEDIAVLLPGVRPVVKKSFSCAGADDFLKELKSLRRKHVLIAGVEAHVCVYQTVSDLTGKGYNVQVVADCVASRRDHDRQIALERMRGAGAVLTTVEMVLCELLKTADSQHFKPIMQLIQ